MAIASYHYGTGQPALDKVKYSLAPSSNRTPLATDRKSLVRSFDVPLDVADNGKLDGCK